jgi:hypothetical protein
MAELKQRLEVSSLEMVTEVFGSRFDQAVLDEWLVELVHPVD